MVELPEKHHLPGYPERAKSATICNPQTSMRRLWPSGGEMPRACLCLFFLISLFPHTFISSHFINIRVTSATRPRDKSERECSQLQHSQMLVAQQQPPQKTLSQSPPQPSSYREKERDRAVSEGVRSRCSSPDLPIPTSFTPPACPTTPRRRYSPAAIIQGLGERT